MEALANFLDFLLKPLLLIAQACALGGLVWNPVIFRAWWSPISTAKSVVIRSIRLVRTGAMVMALAQLAALLTQAWLLGETLHHSPFPAYFHTLPFRAGVIRALLAGGLAWATLLVERRPISLPRWSSALGLAMLLVVSGAWLVHAAGRLEDRSLLMALTVLHQLGALVWLGCLIQLVLLWRLIRRQPEGKPLWPVVLRRFAWVGGPAVVLVVATGLPLTWKYIGTWQGLIGTGYGALVCIKIVLLVTALTFAALNGFLAREKRPAVSSAELHQRVPYFVEVELLLLLTLVSTAASLTSQPPAIDILDQQATWTEVVAVFRPKVPRLTSPSIPEALDALSEESPFATDPVGGVRTYWSDYNHNISGLFLVMMAVLALMTYTGRWPWTRYWPLGFMVLGVFTLVRSDVGTWPFGPTGFWEGLLASEETFQHRLGALLAFALGVLEWRVRITHKPTGWMPYIIPVLCAAGGILLITHAHSAFPVKEEFLLQVTHTAMGALAVIVACGRWLELRLRGVYGWTPRRHNLSRDHAADWINSALLPRAPYFLLGVYMRMRLNLLHYPLFSSNFSARRL